jgi:hypothetical protein
VNTGSLSPRSFAVFLVKDCCLRWAAKPSDRTGQLILIRRSALKTFMPWLAEQLQ